MLRLLDMNTNGYRKDSKKDVLEYNNGENVWIEHSSNLKSISLHNKMLILGY